MKKFNRIKGMIGEEQAIKFLKKKKYKILERNYKNKVGEIDIIALDKKTLVFVEVKERETLAFGRPSEAVDERKQHKIRKTSTLYLIENDLYEKCEIRFDVIEILGDQISHIENAF